MPATAGTAPVITRGGTSPGNLHIAEAELVTIRALWRSLAARDPATAAHSRRVARLARRIGRRLGLGPDELRMLSRAGRLHDIGKLATPDATLRKPGSLDEAERRRIERHVRDGVLILADFPALWQLLPLVATHHERWDGAGYPAGLAGSAIPYGGRILAVADSFDAMTASRPYRGRLPAKAARRILRSGAGTQWDPAVVEAFLGPPR